MADFIEKNEWAEKLRMIEPGDSVIGGVNAPINLPFAGLADRTLWLKNEIAAAVQSIGGLGNNKADKTTQIIAGNGLTGGGALGGNRVLSMGTPSKISATSTNVAVSDTHSHEIDKASTTVAGRPAFEVPLRRRNTSARSPTGEPRAAPTTLSSGA